MRTSVVVAVIFGLGVVALIDGLRSDEEGPAARTSEAAAVGPDDAGVRSAAAAELEARGASGVLYFSDREDDCRVHAVRLPDLTAMPPPKVRSCVFELSPDGRASLGRAVWHPEGGLAARCRGGWVEVRSRRDAPRYRLRGCAPAWKPDGTLTVVRDGEVVAVLPSPERVLLSRRELTKAFRRSEWVGFRFAVEELGWLTNTRIAAIVSARSQGGGIDLLVIFEGARLVRRPSLGLADVSNLRVSPKGGYVVASGEGAAVLDREAESVPLQVDGHALAWSPDERWTAVATDTSVFVFRTDDEDPPPVRLPLLAGDLAWR